MDKNETKVLAFTALLAGGIYGLSRVKSKPKRKRKRKITKKDAPPITELGEKELYDSGLGYSELLESDVQWRLIKQGDMYGWEWDEVPEDEEAEAKIGDSPIDMPSPDEALASLIAELELGNITHPDDVPIPKPEPSPEAGEEPDVDYTEVPAFPLGDGEMRKYLKPGVGMHTIVTERTRMVGLGTWGIDWWIWRPGVILEKSNVWRSGRAPTVEEAFTEAEQEIDSDGVEPQPAEIDYTVIPTFPMGEGSEVRHHPRPPEGEIYTIIMVRKYVTLEGMGLGSWVTDWWAWRAGVELYKARAVLSGRAPSNDEAFDEAAEEIDASTPVAQFVFDADAIEVFPIGADPIVLPALPDPAGLIVSGDCQVAGIGPGFWEAVGGRVEEVVGGGADSVAAVMQVIVPEFFPPVNIDACAGVSAIRNIMLGRVEQYLEKTLGE